MPPTACRARHDSPAPVSTAPVSPANVFSCIFSCGLLGCGDRQRSRDSRSGVCIDAWQRGRTAATAQGPRSRRAGIACLRFPRGAFREDGSRDHLNIAAADPVGSGIDTVSR